MRHKALLVFSIFIFIAGGVFAAEQPAAQSPSHLTVRELVGTVTLPATDGTATFKGSVPARYRWALPSVHPAGERNVVETGAGCYTALVAIRSKSGGYVLTGPPAPCTEPKNEHPYDPLTDLDASGQPAPETTVALYEMTDDGGYTLHQIFSRITGGNLEAVRVSQAQAVAFGIGHPEIRGSAFLLVTKGDEPVKADGSNAFVVQPIWTANMLGVHISGPNDPAPAVWKGAEGPRFVVPVQARTVIAANANVSKGIDYASLASDQRIIPSESETRPGPVCDEACSRGFYQGGLELARYQQAKEAAADELFGALHKAGVTKGDTARFLRSLNAYVINPALNAGQMAIAPVADKDWRPYGRAENPHWRLKPSDPAKWTSVRAELIGKGIAILDAETTGSKTKTLTREEAARIVGSLIDGMAYDAVVLHIGGDGAPLVATLR